MLIDKQIYFFIGTTAELIKVAPIIKELNIRKKSFKMITSGQNVVRFDELKKYIGSVPVYYSFKQRPIGIHLPLLIGFIVWTLKAFVNYFLFFHHELRGANKNNTYFIVHGDTVSSLLGAVIAWFFRVKLVHIESGLRSFNFFEPFPEEICRYIISRLADIHFCPNSWCETNLSSMSGEKINTGQNTLIETFRYAMMSRNSSISTNLLKKKGKKYFVMVVHRQEHILFNTVQTKRIMGTVFQNLPSDIICIFVIHDVSSSFIHTWKDEINHVKSQKVICIEKVNYIEYMHILDNAEFMVTDGGSNQEEMYYMGKPCLLLRKNTERTEGLGENVVLSKNNPREVRNFILNYSTYKRPKIALRIKPSTIIVDHLLS